MAKVTNLTERTVPLHHWKVLPKSSKLLDPQGNLREELPEDLACSKAAKLLADTGKLQIEGYNPPKAEAPHPPVEEKKSLSFGKRKKDSE